MSIEEIRQTQNVILSDRKRAELSGISEVESFHESEILLSSSLGEISVEGNGLKIESFSVESGKILITGHVSGLFYFDKTKSGKNSIFSRRSKA